MVSHRGNLWALERLISKHELLCCISHTPDLDCLFTTSGFAVAIDVPTSCFTVGFLFFFLHNLDSHAWSFFGWCRYWPDMSDRIISLLFTKKQKQIKLVGFVPQWLQINEFLFGYMLNIAKYKYVYMISVYFMHFTSSFISHTPPSDSLSASVWPFLITSTRNLYY